MIKLAFALTIVQKIIKLNHFVTIYKYLNCITCLVENNNNKNAFKDYVNFFLDFKLIVKFQSKLFYIICFSFIACIQDYEFMNLA